MLNQIQDDEIDVDVLEVLKDEVGNLEDHHAEHVFVITFVADRNQ